jgi:hypothetical protein
MDNECEEKNLQPNCDVQQRFPAYPYRSRGNHCLEDPVLRKNEREKSSANCDVQQIFARMSPISRDNHCLEDSVLCENEVIIARSGNSGAITSSRYFYYCQSGFRSNLIFHLNKSSTVSPEETK